MFFFAPNLLWKGANMQKSNSLKKIGLLYFIENNQKIAGFEKPENITSSVFKKFWHEVFEFLITYITYQGTLLQLLKN